MSSSLKLGLIGMDKVNNILDNVFLEDVMEDCKEVEELAIY